jgi:ATP-dependent exoDNAse (exonuclease V) beta subunit
MGPTFGDDRNLRGWAELLLASDEERDARLEELRLFYVAVTRAREKLLLAGTRLAPEATGPEWADGYGAWLERALEEASMSGAGPGALLDRVDLRAADVGRLGSRRDRARSLWDLHQPEIARGAPLPTGIDSGLDAEAARLIQRVFTPAPPPALAPRDIGASDLGRALLCPWRYVYREYLDVVTGNAERGAGAGGGEATERGTRIHAFFEHWNVSRGPLEDFERAAELAGLTGDDMRDLRGWLAEPVVAAALVELALPAAELRRELMFEWSVGGTRISGRLDALVRRPDGTLQVVDFKTDRGDRLSGVYDRQTAIYAAAVERAGLGDVTGRRMIYLRQGRVKDLDWARGDADRLEQQAAGTLKLLGMGDRLSAPACPDCELRKLLGRACVADPTA